MCRALGVTRSGTTLGNGAHHGQANPAQLCPEGHRGPPSQRRNPRNPPFIDSARGQKCVARLHPRNGLEGAGVDDPVQRAHRRKESVLLRHGLAAPDRARRKRQPGKANRAWVSRDVKRHRGRRAPPCVILDLFRASHRWSVSPFNERNLRLHPRTMRSTHGRPKKASPSRGPRQPHTSDDDANALRKHRSICIMSGPLTAMTKPLWEPIRARSPGEKLLG